MSVQIAKLNYKKEEVKATGKKESEIIVLLNGCLSYDETKKKELENLTSKFFKAGDFANYEVCKLLFKEKCEDVYRLETMIEAMEEAGGEPGALLHIAESNHDCGCDK